MTNIEVTKDNDGIGFFSLMHYLPTLADEDWFFNILTVDDGVCENLTLLGIDKTTGLESLYVEDEEGDRFIVFISKIISITPITAEEAQSDGEDEGDKMSPEDME